MEIQKKAFDKVLEDSTRKFKKIPKGEYLEEGLYPIVDQSKDFIAGYTNNENLVNHHNIPVIIFGDHTRALKYVDFPTALGADGAKALTIKSKEYYSKYLYYALKNLVIPDAGYSRHFKFLKESKIPVLKEIDYQKRIAQVLTDCEELIAKRKESIALLDELLKSTFLELFGDPVRNEKGWKTMKLESLVEEFKYGTNSRSSKSRQRNDLPVLRIPNIKDEKINLEELTYASVDQKERDKILLNKGDLLFVRSNGNPDYIGRCAVFDLDGEFGYASYLIRARLKKNVKISPELIKSIISFPTYRNIIVKQAKTTAGNYNINTNGLKSFKIILPDDKSQKQFSLTTQKVKETKTLYQAHLAELENLYGRLSQDAFKGELDLGKVVLREEFLASEAGKKETGKPLLPLIFDMAKLVVPGNPLPVEQIAESLKVPQPLLTALFKHFNLPIGGKKKVTQTAINSLLKKLGKNYYDSSQPVVPVLKGGTTVDSLRPYFMAMENAVNFSPIPLYEPDGTVTFIDPPDAMVTGVVSNTGLLGDSTMPEAGQTPRAYPEWLANYRPKFYSGNQEAVSGQDIVKWVEDFNSNVAKKKETATAENETPLVPKTLADANLQAVSRQIKDVMGKYYFTIHMLEDTIRNKLGLDPSYFTTGQLKNDLQLRQKIDLKQLIFLSLASPPEEHNPFLRLEMLFYDPPKMYHELDMQQHVPKPYQEAYKDQGESERATIYYRIKNEGEPTV